MDYANSLGKKENQEGWEGWGMGGWVGSSDSSSASQPLPTAGLGCTFHFILGVQAYITVLARGLMCNY